MDIKQLAPFLTIAIFLAWLLILFLLEFYFPLRSKTHSFINRLLINFSLSIFSFVVVFLVVSPAGKITMGWTANENFGLLHLVNLSPVVETIIAFLLMDLAFYYWHLANHKIPFLWRFHNVHHIDPELDITTSFRFHFGEITFSTVFRIVQIAVIGITPAAFIIYETCFTLNTMFQHSNIKLPVKLERILNLVIVTPRMHAIHHSQFKNETDSNYSTVFSWWDKLHRTIRLNVFSKDITIGVPAYSNENDNSLKNVFLLPFLKQRDYWKSKNGSLLLSRDKYTTTNPFRLE